MTNETSGTTADMPGDGEKIVWIVFHVLITVLSLFGDTVVLVGTARYKAIKLHRIIVVVIQHLAVSNLLLTLARVIPALVSLVTERWVLGTVLCLANLNLSFICTPATAMLTLVLCAFKLFIVLRPLRSETWSRKRAHVICAIFWLLCGLSPYQITNMFFTTVNLSKPH